ncbi:SAM-dependent methyltransferase [Nioella aestuarii]|uniref:SAM-dependent methyltransferase n=1 Tax=Nioella aestuarii TaxID=1662864 RepID=UPI003D7F548D
MHFTRGKPGWRRAADKLARYGKYGILAPVLSGVVRHTGWLDGGEAPPRVLNYAADGDFLAQGDALVRHIERDIDLEPGTRVLDIGCGIGRLATALARNRSGLIYAGFDVVEYGILWCRKAVPEQAGDYRFDHVDVFNPFYNPRGRLSPDDFAFPYTEGGFDLAVAISVFTHLLEDDTRRYFAEGIRCLAPGGRAYFTTFLTPDTVPEAAHFEFRHKIGAAAVERREEPELAVSYSRAFWEALAAANGARLEQVNEGSWTGAARPDYQDVLIFRKLG